jgi:hypothetical protein
MKPESSAVAISSSTPPHHSLVLISSDVGRIKFNSIIGTCFHLLLAAFHSAGDSDENLWQSKTAEHHKFKSLTRSEKFSTETQNCFSESCTHTRVEPNQVEWSEMCQSFKSLRQAELWSHENHVRLAAIERAPHADRSHVMRRVIR